MSSNGVAGGMPFIRSRGLRTALVGLLPVFFGLGIGYKERSPGVHHGLLCLSGRRDSDTRPLLGKETYTLSARECRSMGTIISSVLGKPQTLREQGHAWLFTNEWRAIRGWLRIPLNFTVALEIQMHEKSTFFVTFAGEEMEPAGTLNLVSDRISSLGSYGPLAYRDHSPPFAWGL